MTLTAESFTGRVLAAFSRRSPGFRPPESRPAPLTVPQRAPAAPTTAGSSRGLTTDLRTRTRPDTALRTGLHLLDEDRPDFERVLDDALCIVLDDDDDDGRGQGRPNGPAGGGPPLNAGQLRTLALASADPISERVGAEYERYRTIRAEAREAARARHSRAFASAAFYASDGAESGAGLAAVFAVLAPLLAGAAAVVFLLVGYSMAAVHPQPGFASPLRTAGWIFAGITGAAILLGGLGLLLTALRDRGVATGDSADGIPPELLQARDTWRQALLDRGLLPFLDDALNGTTATAAPTSAPRNPRLGYSRPDFSSPQDPHPRPAGPQFSSPDFRSPDLSGPDFSSPDSGGPDHARE